MTQAQILAGVMTQFIHRGLPLEKFADAARVITQAVATLPEISHEKAINWSVQVFAEKLS